MRNEDQIARRFLNVEWERRSPMQHDEMTIDDAVNIAHVANEFLAGHADEDVRELAIAAKRLACHVAAQSREMERERARRHALGREHARLVDGYRLEEGTDAGERRDFLGGCAVHAGQTLYLLTCVGWHAVRYESNMPDKAPVLYLPLPGVQHEVVIAVPRGARFAWPEELGRT
jgi:hypothetical protein